MLHTNCESNHDVTSYTLLCVRIKAVINSTLRNVYDNTQGNDVQTAQRLYSCSRV